MSWLSDRLRPPSSWDSFTRGTLAPVVKTGATALGALVGGPAGGALGASLGGIAGDAVAGENVRKSTTLRSVGGDAIGGALAGYAAQAGPLAKLLGRGGEAIPGVQIDLPVDALNPGAGTFTSSIGANAVPAASVAAKAASMAAPTATGGTGGLTATLKDWASIVGPASQAALGYGQAKQQQRLADEGLNFLRSNYKDRDAYRQQALALLGAPAPDTSVLIEDPTFRRAR